MSAASGLVDPDLRSWVAGERDSGRPLQALPLGVVERDGAAHVCTAIGGFVLDLHRAAVEGVIGDALDARLLEAPTLNPLLAAGTPALRALRARLVELLKEGGDPALRSRDQNVFFIPYESAHMRMPFTVGDYVDFYASREHATNLGRIFRPDGEPLLPNWVWIPIGYHGRAGTVVPDGTPIRRPNGQRKDPRADAPEFGPSRMLDVELEVGFVTCGPANPLGEPIPLERAREQIAGLVLVNDWSARDIQSWEYQPLGPFLGKSFATTISPWLVPLDALEPFRADGPPQDPQPLPYLRESEPRGYDIRLEIALRTAAMRERGIPPEVVARTNFRGMYWSIAQMLAHATSNGAIARPGDLFASGTVSGSEPGTYGSLIELTWRGTYAIELPGGERRTFLEDGDEVILRGCCERDGWPRLDLGSCRGVVLPAPPLPDGIAEA